jgi:hypothetical protein
VTDTPADAYAAELASERERTQRAEGLIPIERITPRLDLVVDEVGCIVLLDHDAGKRHTVTNVDLLVNGLRRAQETVAMREDRAREARVMGRVRTPWVRVEDDERGSRWELPGDTHPSGALASAGHLVTDQAIRTYGRRHLEQVVLKDLPPLPEEAWLVDTPQGPLECGTCNGARTVPADPLGRDWQGVRIMKSCPDCQRPPAWTRPVQGHATWCPAFGHAPSPAYPCNCGLPAAGKDQS